MRDIPVLGTQGICETDYLGNESSFAAKQYLFNDKKEM